MKQTQQHRSARRRHVTWSRAAATVVGAMLTSTLWVGALGAATTTTADTISTAKVADLGTILVADTTVYTLDLGGKKCTAKCEKLWHAVVLPAGTTKPSAGAGVDAKKLGTVKAADGDRQVTYEGDPLYWYAKDTSPGDVKGEGTTKFGTGAVVVTVKPSSGGGGGTDVGSGGTAF